MLSFNPYDLAIPKRHQFLTGGIGPRPICWASTVDENGKPNLAPYSFFNVFGANPPTVIFSSNRRGRDNTTKDTLHNIEHTKEVVINIVPYSLVHQMNICSTDYPTNINEFTKAGVTPIDSVIVKAKRVKESPIQFECKVKEIIYTGKEGGAANLFICEVVHMHIAENILGEDGMIDPQKLDLVGRMGKNYYVRASGDAVFEINNPFEKINLGFDGLPKHIVESTFLTGNEIAQMAMETELPTKEEILKNKELFLTDETAKFSIAKQLIKENKVREALSILL
ncbi:MAG: flavin reductase family protein [Chitinophagales bacterium]|nr:flavin reductase family protein [Chitinophagales bacterium]